MHRVRDKGSSGAEKKVARTKNYKDPSKGVLKVLFLLSSLKHASLKKFGFSGSVSSRFCSSTFRFLLANLKVTRKDKFWFDILKCVKHRTDIPRILEGEHRNSLNVIQETEFGHLQHKHKTKTETIILSEKLLYSLSTKK